MSEETSQNPRREARRPASLASRLVSLAIFGAAALGVIQFYEPLATVESRGDVDLAAFTGPFAFPSPNAFGRSGEVMVVFALPGTPVTYPLEVRVHPSELAYRWVPLADTAALDLVPSLEARALADGPLEAPTEPGFYRLALFKGESAHLVDGPALSVLVPFAEKLGTTLNGYRIGTYVAERLGAKGRDRPDGFVQIMPELLDVPLSRHLRLSDFVTHDGQQTWPRYAALDGRLLDKLELVVAELARIRGDTGRVQISVDVHSGFRTPIYNRRVRLAARDSRHQYGDAADVSIDANGDGRVTATDTRLVARAVEEVERAHPDLVGGMGLYIRGNASYVHIDARGRRARWRG